MNLILFPRYKREVYLHWNFWCNADDSLQNSYCENVINDYNYDLIKEYKKHDYRYALYRLELKDQEGKPLYKAKYPKLPNLTIEPEK